MKIIGMEVTQGVQFFHSHQHLIANSGPDNSLRLVALKPAWVRVYLRSDTSDSVANVTGTLGLERLEQSSYKALATLTPNSPGIVTAHPDLTYYDERGSIQRTLNFVIPSGLMCGRLRLTAQLTAAGGEAASHSINIDVTLLQRLKIRGIMVGYDGLDASGNSVKLAPPTLTDLIRTGAWLPSVYPIAYDPSYSLASGFTHTSSVASVKGPCGHASNWGGLMAKYVQAKQSDGEAPGYVYYGLLAVDHPGANSAGCAGTDFVCSGAGEGVPHDLDGTWELTAETTMAHELGHHLGRQHAPGLTPDPDPAYPTYKAALPGQSYDDGSVGEYGLDINTGTVYPPYEFADFMSYRERRWISPYTWNSLLHRPLLNPSTVCAEIQPWLEKYIEWPPKLKPKPLPGREWRYQPIISVVAVLGPGRHVDVQSVTRAPVASDPVSDHGNSLAGGPTPYVVELVGRDGKLIAAAAFRHRMSVACGRCDAVAPGDAVVAEARLPDVAPGALLRVTRDGDELWTRKAPPAPPEILAFDATLSDQETLTARWRVRAVDERELHYWLRWCVRGEDNWHGLAVGLQGTETRVGVNPILPGNALIQLVAHDGFFSVQSGPVAIVVPPRPASVTIVSPSREQGLYAGATLRLLALVSGATRERVDADAVRWLVDDREVGHGREVFIVTPAPGEHRCEVRLQLDDAEAADQVVFRTFPGPAN